MEEREESAHPCLARLTDRAAMYKVTEYKHTFGRGSLALLEEGRDAERRLPERRRQRLFCELVGRQSRVELAQRFHCLIVFPSLCCPLGRVQVCGCDVDLEAKLPRRDDSTRRSQTVTGTKGFVLTCVATDIETR